MGWMNDPNGLCFFGGLYHAFYQHHPHSTEWGPMHWGHATSEDMLAWRHEPIALFPGKEGEPDRDGCFSGSAIEWNGSLYLLYTGHVSSPEQRQSQCLAFSRDGLAFEKHRANPVLRSDDSEGGRDFRDPKVWRRGNDFFALVGSAYRGAGRIILYRSKDLHAWEAVGPVLDGSASRAAMCECPDFFSLDGRDVLIHSPIGRPGHKNVYAVGSLDYETGHFETRHEGELDLGPDFYAAQTFEAPDGRRIIMAWMDAWGAEMPEKALGWAGSQCLPRELRLSGHGELLCRPIGELAAWRKPLAFNAPMPAVGSVATILDSAPHCLDIELEFAGSSRIVLRRSSDGERGLTITWNREKASLEVDATRSGRASVAASVIPSPARSDGAIGLRIVLDRSSAEIFSTDGGFAYSTRIYPQAQDSGLELRSQGGRIARLSIYGLSPPLS
jgi:beta-fructofuranosidase